MQSNDLISRKALIEDLMNLEVVGGHKMYRKGCDHTLHGLVPEMINAQTAVDAVILPPVKTGDTAYFIIGGKVYKAEVHFVRWEQHKQYGIHSEISASVIPNYSVGASFDDFGKTVFLTREEAEAELAKMG